MSNVATITLSSWKSVSFCKTTDDLKHEIVTRMQLADGTFFFGLNNILFILFVLGGMFFTKSFIAWGVFFAYGVGLLLGKWTIVKADIHRDGATSVVVKTRYYPIVQLRALSALVAIWRLFQSSKN